MPVLGATGPRPASCEDYDDDAGTTVSASKATTYVAVRQSKTGQASPKSRTRHHRDGSDSGYSSRAGTVASEPLGPKKTPNLKIETVLPERERQPYHMSAQGRPKAREEALSQKKEHEPVSAPAVDRPFVHPQGVCMTCDKYGRHLDMNELSQLASQPPTPSSLEVAKKVSSNASNEHDRNAALRRLSSTRDTRPTNIYPPSAIQPVYAVNPAYSVPSGYAMPLSPTTAYSPAVQNYAAYATTPVTSAYSGYAGQTSYFETQPVVQPREQKTSRRSSFYADDFAQAPRRGESSGKVERMSSKRDSRPLVKTHRSQQSIDEDRITMPPPARPSKVSQVVQRPGLQKASTYQSDVREHRRSRDQYDNVYSTTPARHDRSRSPQQPPSSYRNAPGRDEPTSRPRPSRKSVSYQEPIHTTKVAKTPTREEHLPRRTTMPTTPLEQREAEVEAYQRKRSQMTSNQLSAEKLAELKGQTISSRSETGSTRSHQESHQSSSKASSGRVRSNTSGHRTSIIIDGIRLEVPDDYVDRKGRPVSINMDGLTISMGSKDKNQDQKLLEKTPSITSHASKRSVTDSSLDSSSRAREQDRRNSLQSSRRPSHTDDRSRPPVAGQSQKSSRQHSRTPSSTRASVDHSRSRRQSVDYEDARLYYGA